MHSWMSLLFEKIKLNGFGRKNGNQKDTSGWDARGQPEGISRLVWQNLWPVFGLMLLNFTVGYTDIYVAGLLGTDVQAAVGFVSQQYFLLIIVGNALAVGTVALVSRATGGNQWGRVFGLTRQVLILTSSLGGALWLFSILGAPAIVQLFDLPEAIRPLALIYLRIYALALLPNYLIIVSGAIFRAAGKPLTAFKIMTIVTLLNIGANFGLVFGVGPLPALGFRGIAWATVIAMFAGLGCVLLVFRTPAWLPMWDEKWRLSREVSLQVIGISWPAALLQLGWNAGNLAIYQILGRLGEKSVQSMAAYANGLRLESITYLPAFAFNMVAAVLVGQSMGADSFKQAKGIGWKVALAGSLSLSLLSILLFWTAPQLAHLLTHGQEVWRETVRYLRVNLLVAPLMVLSMVLGGAMQGAGDTRGVMKIILLAIWLIRLPLAALLCFHMELRALGVWIAMDVSMVVQAVLMTRRFAGEKWKKE